LDEEFFYTMIEVDQVSKQFEGRWIFKSVSFKVEKGCTAVLIGPSGGGKSVLLRTIAGLFSPDEGVVRLGTENVGMLFQKNALFDSLTVEENLLFPLKERKGIVGKPAQERAAYFLSEVGLSGTGSLYPDEISGGMQKRLGIARALIVEPEVILYDEPTAGLDPITSKMIAELIQGLRKNLGTTVLAVTNDVQRAYQLGEQIYLLAQSRLSRGGTPSEVQDTRDPALKQFIYGLKIGPLTSGIE
jgi:phospholipid/cholesterol/gamma-HCH transport system ATP-binding protein